MIVPYMVFAHLTLITQEQCHCSVYGHRHSLPAAVMDAIKPVFRDRAVKIVRRDVFIG
jgi:hypothetical protein